MKTETIRLFAISKLAWIKQHQQKLRGQEREPPRDYVERESHYLWGKRYLLKIMSHDGRPSVELKHKTIVLRARSGLPTEKRAAAVAAWYREQLRAAIPLLLDKWQPLLGVKANRFYVQRMKTKWGG